MGSNNTKTAILFPGQGSQFVGMGKEFLDSDPAAAELMALAESVSGFPLRQLCTEGPLEELTRAETHRVQADKIARAIAEEDGIAAAIDLIEATRP